MSSNDPDLQLAAEMATINTATSRELVELTKGTGKLQQLQQKLDEDKDRVDIVKKILTEVDEHKVDPSLARQMDNYLTRSDVDIPAGELGSFQGAEELGHTLLPAVYLQTRLAGCENFLGDFYRKAKEITTQISIGFKDSYLLFTQSVDSLNALVDILESDVKAAPTFKAGTDTILLGTRLFNLFKINGRVNEDWVSSLTKLSGTINALSSNYYQSNQVALNNTLSYFGGFDKVDDDGAKERLLLLPKAVPSNRFKECSYPNKELSTSSVVAKQSVELMGGAYFVDTRREKVNLNLNSVDQVLAYVQGYVDLDGVSFFNNSPVEYPKIGTEIKTLSSETILAVIKLVRSILQAWRKSSEGMERYKVGDSDFSDITKGIYESSMSDEMKDTVQTAFTSIVRKTQMEMLTNRSSVNNYLVLIVNGLIELCNTSIAVNLPE